MRSRKFARVVAVVSVACAAASPVLAQDPLIQGFKDPPNIARPRVYWYWQNGNITNEGITKDLEWMHRAGIGGVETFDVAVVTPNIVPKRLLYMTPEWKDAFHHSLEIADRLGMTVTIGAAPGWSQTGGPWVKPADAMKKLVWSETVVEGGPPFHGTLPNPPNVNGPFQGQPREVRPDRPIPAMPTLYRDQLVLAFHMPAGEETLETAHPIVTSSGGHFTYADLIHGTWEHTQALPARPGESSWIQIAFPNPQTVRGVTVAVRGVLRVFADDTLPVQALEASDDGVHFRRIADLPRTTLYQRTYAFPPVTARYFRYKLPAATSDAFNICRFELHTATPVHRAEEKAGFGAVPDYYAVTTPPADPASVVPTKDVLNLTEEMRPDGTLEWTPPAGKWMVLRVGYALTGQTNGPAPLEATGFEVDKLKNGATRTFMDEYLKRYDDASGGMMGRHGVNNVATDSWGAGFQNWTDGILDEFRRLRGYDPTPWVPALTGRVVQSSDDHRAVPLGLPPHHRQSRHHVQLRPGSRQFARTRTRLRHRSAGRPQSHHR